MQKIEEKLIKLFKKDPRFVDQDGELLKSEVIDKAYKIDKKLIELLLEDLEAKRKFFTEIKKHWVFNINTFVSYIQDKNFLADSYTKFKNKIGLNIDGKFFNERKEVALIWPFKDCVLEGGMAKEDEKRKEIFFNEILAQDEIDQLFAPKVLTNWKRYQAKGEEEVKELKRDEDGTLRENLLIKGNNLLALHSLKKQFQGKVKLIYIDPPYNTDTDTFSYNDSFSHSTWLTFMKNRLEVAKELLSADGSVYVQLDYNEAHYGKVLMDEIFGRENFQREIIWRIGWLSGYKTAEKNYIRNHDTILFYSKNKDFLFNKTYIKYDDNYVRRDGKKPDGEGYPLEDTWNCSNIDTLNSIAIQSFSKEKFGQLKGQKPELLIKRIIESSSNIGDIVIDFHLGTGTACAVAHKLGRQYIGIEQLNYGKYNPEKRLYDVVRGDQTGISKIVDWKGGGNFICCELAKYNEKFVDEIQKAKNSKKLLEIWKEMKEKSFLNYRIKPEEFDRNIADFKKLSLAKQKETLMQLLNKNQMYVNLSEMEDRELKVNKNDKRLNKYFYET